MWNLFSVSFLFDEDSKCKTHCNVSVKTVHTQFLFLIPGFMMLFKDSLDKMCSLSSSSSVK